MLGDLRGKRVLITGASGGIGSAIAHVFASFGAKIGVHYHKDVGSARRVAQEAAQMGGEAAVFQADLERPAACDKLMRSFVKRFGGIDVLINNAGFIWGYSGFETLKVEDWDRTMGVNARAPFLLSRAAFALMKSGGRIINVSSTSAKFGGSGRTMHYAAAKAALEALTLGFARMGASRGILVNAIRAGYIDTDVHKVLGRADVAERIALIPLKRAGKPSEVAQAAAFLACDAASYITGEILNVTGGN